MEDRAKKVEEVRAKMVDDRDDYIDRTLQRKACPIHFKKAFNHPRNRIEAGRRYACDEGSGSAVAGLRIILLNYLFYNVNP